MFCLGTTASNAQELFLVLFPVGVISQGTIWVPGIEPRFSSMPGKHSTPVHLSSVEFKDYFKIVELFKNFSSHNLNKFLENESN